MAINFLNTVAVDDSVLFVDTVNDRVGIGTNSPEGNLEISDSTQATGATLSITNAHIGSWVTGDKIGSIDFRIDDTSTTEPVRAKIHAEGKTTGTYPSSSQLVFSTANANTLSEVMRIDSAGNVGIGTTAPNGKLDVTGNIWLNSDNANAAYYLRINRGQSQDGGILLYGNGVLDWQLVNLANRDLNWYSYGVGSSVMRLTSAGNLGIGTTSPGEKLDVNGNVKIKDTLLSNQENTDIDTGAEVVAQVAIATYTAAFFDFVVKKTTNVRSGTVYACHDGTSVVFTETSTNDLGDTSDVTLSVDILGTNMRLLATVTSDDWSVKSLIRAI